MQITNPFNLTKANDFTDRQIQQFWVDIPGDASLLTMLKPTSPMPILILGGKGSGKTHLMRYCSFELQKLMAGKEPLPNFISQNGYIGIYMRCEGLNAERFSGKGQTEEIWSGVFQYYMELYLAELLLVDVYEVIKESMTQDQESALLVKIKALFDVLDPSAFTDFSGLLDHLKALRTDIDYNVNNCALTERLNFTISVTRGRMLFGIPHALREIFIELKDLLFLYLIDELENFSESQQRYVFTLVRERKEPVSFRVGARLYGIRTYSTFSGEEEIKEGAEYERVALDEMMRKNNSYPEFAKRLIATRISKLINPDLSAEELSSKLSSCFEQHEVNKFKTDQVAFVAEKYSDSERPYFEILKRDILTHRKQLGALAPKDSSAIDSLVETIRMPEYPLLEKFNCFLIYQSWNDGENLEAAAARIKDACVEFANGAKDTDYAQTYGHFSGDMLAQLLRDARRDQEYVGLETFIIMSMGLPRNLLIILRHVYNWALFNNEQPFQGGSISINSQQKGIMQAAEWFLRDARTKGAEGQMLQEAISRLAVFFRKVRFSAKPVECSLCSFSVDQGKVNKETLDALNLAEKYSLLIAIVEGQRDRNSMRVDAKYQINSMLSPIWDLPISRRGSIPIQPDLADAIFNSEKKEVFEVIVHERVAGMSPPFSRPITEHPTLNLFT